MLGQREGRVERGLERAGIAGVGPGGIVRKLHFLPEDPREGINSPRTEGNEAGAGHDGPKAFADACEGFQRARMVAGLDLEAAGVSIRVERQEHRGTRTLGQRTQDPIAGWDEGGWRHSSGMSSGWMGSSASLAHWLRMRRTMRMRIMRTLNRVVLNVRATSGEGISWKQ